MICSIGWLCVLLSMTSLGLIMLVLYVFRLKVTLPAAYAVSEQLIVWPTQGNIVGIHVGAFLGLNGSIYTIQSELFDQYTHVAPIYGCVTHIIPIRQHAKYNNGIYIQIENSNFTVGVLICSPNDTLREMYVSIQETVYAGQPLCLTVFNATVYVALNNFHKTFTYYLGQQVQAADPLYSMNNDLAVLGRTQ